MTSTFLSDDPWKSEEGQLVKQFTLTRFLNEEAGLDGGVGLYLQETFRPLPHQTSSPSSFPKVTPSEF